MVTVLIVDDDKFLHEVLEHILTLGGHIVIDHAYNGKEAIEKYVSLKSKPDIILMDHRMPIMDGASATRELKQLDQSVIVVFFSADDTVKDSAKDAGADGFLVKPINSTTLFEAIDEYPTSS
ncbi:MAG: response regulator [Candidatus Thorarchaeota archaeon]